MKNYLDARIAQEECGCALPPFFIVLFLPRLPAALRVHKLPKLTNTTLQLRWEIHLLAHHRRLGLCHF
jgi:hypothetical protein